MARKKMTQEDKPTQKNQEQQQTHQTFTMEDASEKLENLKSLNSMLLKETFERRQLVGSLQLSNGSLESQLTRTNSENEGLKSELTQLSDLAVQLELERSLVFVFVSEQVGQGNEVFGRERDGFRRERVEMERKMGCLEREMREVMREKTGVEKLKHEKETEIGLLTKNLNDVEVEIGKERDFSSQVCREKDEVRAKLDVQIEESNGFIVKLIEMETREREIQEEVKKLKIEYNGVVEEKEERGRKIDSMMRDNDLMEGSLVESNQVVEEMKREIEGMVREKEGVEEERSVEMRKRKELENVVSSLNEMVLSLRKEEERLLANVDELEKRCIEGVEKQKQMEFEMKEMNKRFESFIGEKGLVTKDLNETLKQLDEQNSKVEKIVREKIEIEEAKLERERESLGLQKQVDDLKDTLLSLEESCKDRLEKIKRLEFEVKDCRCAIDRVTMEKDEARKSFDEEILNGVNLREKILEMEKSIEESKKVAGGMEAENCKLIGEKKQLESRCMMLMNEKALVVETLVEARKEFDNMQGKVKLADANSELVLNMLRNTVVVVSSNDKRGIVDNGVVTNGNNGKEEIEPYVAELEAIKNAFKSEENKLEEMMQQLQLLQNSVAEAHKKKGFWTMVSSATIFAALTVAYVACGH